MKHALRVAATPMGMALLLWLCALPLVALLVLPFFEVQVAIWTAVGLLTAALIVCWTICAGPRQC